MHTVNLVMSLSYENYVYGLTNIKNLNAADRLIMLCNCSSGVSERTVPTQRHYANLTEASWVCKQPGDLHFGLFSLQLLCPTCCSVLRVPEGQSESVMSEEYICTVRTGWKLYVLTEWYIVSIYHCIGSKVLRNVILCFVCK